MTASIEMPRYICHKQVWALKIKTIEAGPFADAPSSDALVKLHFHEEGYAPLGVSPDWYYKHKPAPGGYFVVYKDGYRSFSPAEAFEDGYTPEARVALAHQPSGQEQPEAEPASCIEEDGCPNELAVLQRFWRENQPSGQAQQDAIDAARYRWLRLNGYELIGSDRGLGPEFPYGDELDAAIDRARRVEEMK